MPNSSGKNYVSDDELTECMEAYESCDQNMSAGARFIGMHRTTFVSRVRTAQVRGIKGIKVEDVEIPPLMSGELPVEDKIEYMAKRYTRKEESYNQRQWFPIKFKDNLPFGLAFVGDPHLDSGGCNWPLLQEDVKIMASTPGMYATNLGDTTDNWVGRLSRLYAHNPATRSDAIDFAEWLISKAGVKWLWVIRGNHDMWTDSRKDDPLNWMKHPVENAPTLDWDAKVTLQFPNKTEVKVWTQHNFKGTSIYNPLHGLMRAAKFTQLADIYAAGHIHEYSILEHEDPLTHKHYFALRARGYKHIDTFAELHGFGSQRYGSTVVAVFDPCAADDTRINCFSNLPEAAEFLTWKRSKRRK